MSTVANPFRERAQHRKAHAIARMIWAKLTTEQRTDPKLPESVTRMSQAERDGWAWEAGQMVPSPESWGIVVDEIREKVEDERRWRGLA